MHVYEGCNRRSTLTVRANGKYRTQARAFGLAVWGCTVCSVFNIANVYCVVIDTVGCIVWMVQALRIGVR